MSSGDTTRLVPVLLAVCCCAVLLAPGASALTPARDEPRAELLLGATVERGSGLVAGRAHNRVLVQSTATETRRSTSWTPTAATSAGSPTSPAYDRDPAWSPDGGTIVFASDNRICVMNADGSERASRGGIYAMNGDGSNLRRLTHDVTALELAWSPDGRRIAFQSSRRGNHAIYVMNADGTEQRQLTE